jgi:formylglycine-generating enzyme required for sulfatase activity
MISGRVIFHQWRSLSAPCSNSILLLESSMFDSPRFHRQLAQGLLLTLATLLPLSAFAQTDKTFTNSIGTEFILIPAGSFTMGADKNFEDAFDDETPQHRISISQSFYLGKYPVTQAEWVAVMGNNPSKFKGRSNPVEQVSWNDVQTFIQRLNAKEGTKKYRLPTEAEWEYAARGGTKSTYSFGDDAGQLGQYAWYDGNSGSQLHPVGQKKPNPWGLYDMYGNVMEWVNDWFDSNYYSRSPSTDPTGPSSGRTRVLRGGSWYFDAGLLRSAYRNHYSPDLRIECNGFRLALSPGQ